MKHLHLIMPMGGRGSRFSEEGIEIPKPLINISGKPFFYWSTMSIAKFVDLEDITFVVLYEHVKNFHIDAEIRSFFPCASIHVIPEVLNGAVLTCIEGLKEVSDSRSVVFNDCDHMFRSRAFEEFCKDESYLDGALLTFKSQETKYSYVKADAEGNVIRTEEKKVVSDEAVCGCYYFANKALFLKAAERYLHVCSYKEFYISGIYNIMAEWGSMIKSFRTDFHLPFGTPEEWEEAKRSMLFEEFT